MANPFEDFRKLTKHKKSSYYVIIPPDIIRKLKWKESQKLTVRRRGKKIIIEAWDPQKQSSS